MSSPSLVPLDSTQSSIKPVSSPVSHHPPCPPSVTRAVNFPPLPTSSGQASPPAALSNPPPRPGNSFDSPLSPLLGSSSPRSTRLRSSSRDRSRAPRRTRRRRSMVDTAFKRGTRATSGSFGSRPRHSRVAVVARRRGRGRLARGGGRWWDRDRGRIRASQVVPRRTWILSRWHRSGRGRM